MQSVTLTPFDGKFFSTASHLVGSLPGSVLNYVITHTLRPLFLCFLFFAARNFFANRKQKQGRALAMARRKAKVVWAKHQAKHQSPPSKVSISILLAIVTATATRTATTTATSHSTFRITAEGSSRSKRGKQAAAQPLGSLTQHQPARLPFVLSFFPSLTICRC